MLVKQPTFYHRKILKSVSFWADHKITGTTLRQRGVNVHQVSKARSCVQTIIITDKKLIL